MFAMRFLTALLIVLFVASVSAQSAGPNKSGPSPRKPPIVISAGKNGNFGWYHGDVGPFWSYLNVWDPPRASSYAIEIGNDPSSYPDGTVMKWSFPRSLNGTSNVYAYPDIVYGVLGGGLPPTPAHRPRPVRLGSLPRDFSLTFNVTPNAGADDQDLLVETWPTSVPNPENPISVHDSRTREVGVFAHTPPYLLNFLLTLPNHLNYSAGRFHAYIVEHPQSPPFIIIIPVTAPGGTTPVDMIGATHEIPFGDLLRFLIAKGMLDPKNYITGCQFGFEIGRGSGDARINFIRWHWK